MQIAKATTEDHDQIVELSDKIFGPGYIELSELEQLSCLVAKSDDKVIGFSTYKIISKKDFDLLHPKLEDYDFGYLIGFLGSIAVEKERQKNGVGYALTRQAIDYLSQADSIVSLAWKQKTTPAAKLLTNLGLSRVTEIQDYWFEESVEKNYTCQGCGKPPCLCTAELYMKQNGF